MQRFILSILLALSFLIFSPEMVVALDEKIFHKKMQQRPQQWVLEQITHDLGAFQSSGISQDALNQTLETSLHTILNKINKVAAYHRFVRYRVINNEIYRFGPENYLDQALKTLSQMVTLPSIDLLEIVDWARKHDKECQQIAENATELVANQLMEEDNYLYLYRLLAYYEKLQTFKTEDFFNEVHTSDKWIKVN